MNAWSFDPLRTVDTNINVYIYIYIPGTQMTLFFGWKRPWFGGLTFKIEVIGAPCTRIVNRLLHRPCGTLSIPGCNQLGYSGSTRRLLGPQNPSTCPNTPTRLTGGYLHSWVHYKTIYVYNLNEYISTYVIKYRIHIYHLTQTRCLNIINTTAIIQSCLMQSISVRQLWKLQLIIQITNISFSKVILSDQRIDRLKASPVLPS